MDVLGIVYDDAWYTVIVCTVMYGVEVHRFVICLWLLIPKRTEHSIPFALHQCY